MRIYEYDSEEIDDVLPFRNVIFGHISRERWEAMNCTAVVARKEGRLVGFIPLQYREQALSKEVTIPVVYENAVGVAEGMRGQGVGTQMLDEAARFVSDRADALMVIRGGERSDGYRFYRKTGHADLMYARTYAISASRCQPQEGEGIAVVDRDGWLELEPALLDLYEHQYGRFGGGRRRRPGYWQLVLDSHVYQDRRWWLVVLRSGDHPSAEPVGYMVAVLGRLWAPSEDIHVYEVVGRDQRAVERLLRYAGELARENGEPAGTAEAADRRLVVPYVSLANPVASLLERMGFEREDSTPHIMARILCPDRIFGQLAAGSDLIDTLSLRVSTPHRTMTVNAPREARYTVSLETKESLLSRLFCCRLDLEAAVATEMVRWDVRDPGLGRTLCRVFAFSEWVQWFTDYV